MTLDYDALADKLKHPLPGAAAHEPLRAIPSGKLIPKFEHSLPPRPGAVLILLYEQDNHTLFPLTKRPDYLGTHGGQVSFPGGKAEAGETIVETALREAEEEIGIHRNSVNVLGLLSPFFVIPSNFMVTPVVGVLTSPPVFHPDPKEVGKILTGSVEDLVRADAIRTKEILAARQFPMMAPHFEIDGEVVWGATAMMLNEFRQVVISCLKP